MTRAWHEISCLLPERKAAKRRVVAQRPNHVSVALQATMGDRMVLLGSDLEEENDSNVGWSAVIANHTNVGGRSKIYKVAHHGSPNAHHDGIYTDLLEPAPIAILTPFRRSGLPADSDVQRMMKRCEGVHLSAPVSPPKSTQRDRTTEKIMKDMVRRRRAESVQMGLVRLRWTTGKGLQVEHFGSAHRAA
jgi:hypothetical protein